MKEVTVLHPQAIIDVPLKLHLKPVLDLTDDDRLYEFCQLNRDLQPCYPATLLLCYFATLQP